MSWDSEGHFDGDFPDDPEGRSDWADEGWDGAEGVPEALAAGFWDREGDSGDAFHDDGPADAGDESAYIAEYEAEHGKGSWEAESEWDAGDELNASLALAHHGQALPDDYWGEDFDDRWATLGEHAGGSSELPDTFPDEWSGSDTFDTDSDDEGADERDEVKEDRDNAGPWWRFW